MEIKINITPENKDRILKLLSELVEAEQLSDSIEKRMQISAVHKAQGIRPDIVVSDSKGKRHIIEIKSHEKQREVDKILSQLTEPSNSAKDYLYYYDMPKQFPSGYLATTEIQKSTVGSWYMFNSYFAAKAVLRVLANLAVEQKNNVLASRFLDTFYIASGQKELLIYRGFPKDKEQSRHDRSNINKVRYFILLPLEEMGFVSIKKLNNKDEQIQLTEQGLKFALMENPKLDRGEEQLLSKEESNFLRAYLKQIDAKGYREHAILEQLLDYLEKTSKSKNRNP